MPKFIEITKHNIRESYYEKLYEWRFIDYIEYFSTNKVPSMDEHKNFIKNELYKTNIKWYGMVEEDNLIACCSTEKSMEKEDIKEYTLGRVMVDPRRRRQNLGSTLISECIKKISQLEERYCIKLEVINTNITAISLYKKMGFVEVAKEDGLLYMVRGQNEE